MDNKTVEEELIPDYEVPERAQNKPNMEIVKDSQLSSMKGENIETLIEVTTEEEAGLMLLQKEDVPSEIITAPYSLISNVEEATK
ncbi:hypothetical protein AVEN_191096-1 [Araneus ventricosus]|uniref:Uncharacterized protein n=1 Tax=Araneus ventricosus TaxID=182803 RepID=A0A4Y2B024_ARAVE|nr:hypothetical protein AVEN_191096-1 [Araneus ventricosus]